MKSLVSPVDRQGWELLNSKARQLLTSRDMDWLVEGAGLFNDRRRIDQAIRTAFDDPPWWPEWRAWRNLCKDRRDDGDKTSPAYGSVTDLTYPPDEPVGLWEKAGDLLISGTYLESISAAKVRLLVAQGRIARRMLK